MPCPARRTTRRDSIKHRRGAPVTFVLSFRCVSANAEHRGAIAPESVRMLFALPGRGRVGRDVHAILHVLHRYPDGRVVNRRPEAAADGIYRRVPSRSLVSSFGGIPGLELINQDVSSGRWHGRDFPRGRCRGARPLDASPWRGAAASGRAGDRRSCRTRRCPQSGPSPHCSFAMSAAVPGSRLCPSWHRSGKGRTGASTRGWASIPR